MNRIILKYKQEDENNNSELNIYNDIKGLTIEQIGKTLYGNDADIMFELLKNVDYSKVEDSILYEVTVLNNNKE